MSFLEISANLLHVSGKSEQIIVSNDKTRLTKEQIDKIIADGNKFAAEDELHKKRTEAVNDLSSFVYSLKSQLGEKQGMGAKLDRADEAKLQIIIGEGSEWIDEYGKEATLEELEEKLAGRTRFPRYMYNLSYFSLPQICNRGLTLLRASCIANPLHRRVMNSTPPTTLNYRHIAHIDILYIYISQNKLGYVHSNGDH